MKQAGKMLASLLASLVFGTGATSAIPADALGSPYQGIVDRNVFGLKPPPPPPDPELVKPPTPKFDLTGITTISGIKRALLKARPPARPGEAAKEQSYMLTEGERQGDVEVVQINELTGIVKVKCGDAVLSLDFTNNAAKAVAAAPPPPMPGAPGAPPPGFGVPAPQPAGANPNFRPPTGPAVRQLRTPGGGTAGGNPMGTAPLGVGGVPAPVGQGLAYGQPAQSQVAAAQLPRDQQEVLMEVLRDQQRNNPQFPPLPPTSLTPLLDAANSETAAPVSGRTTMNFPPIPGRPGLPPGGGPPPLPVAGGNF